MVKNALFITFEGSDGTGKSTQIAKTAAYLRDKGFPVLLTREPGGTRIGEKIREMLLDRENSDMRYETEALLCAAARAQHVGEVISPALAEGRVVICDRFVDSSLAYQGHARGLGVARVLNINVFGTGGLEPDITFYLCLPAAIAARRREAAGEADRIELSGETFMRTVGEGYDRIAYLAPDRMVRIDASGSIEDVFDRIKNALDKKIL